MLDTSFSVRKKQRTNASMVEKKEHLPTLTELDVPTEVRADLVSNVLTP